MHLPDTHTHTHAKSQFCAFMLLLKRWLLLLLLSRWPLLLASVSWRILTPVSICIDYTLSPPLQVLHERNSFQKGKNMSDLEFVCCKWNDAVPLRQSLVSKWLSHIRAPLARWLIEKATGAHLHSNEYGIRIQRGNTKKTLLCLEKWSHYLCSNVVMRWVGFFVVSFTNADAAHKHQLLRIG